MLTVLIGSRAFVLSSEVLGYKTWWAFVFVGVVVKAILCGVVGVAANATFIFVRIVSSTVVILIITLLFGRSRVRGILILVLFVAAFHFGVELLGFPELVKVGDEVVGGCKRLLSLASHDEFLHVVGRHGVVDDSCEII
jgi:hypothetical protein